MKQYPNKKQMKQRKIPIAVARGDGIGPEIMDAVLKILEAAGAPLDIEEVEIGEKVYLRGIPTGIEERTWDIIKKSRAFLKAPITTPQGGGFKSLNVTVRTTLGLYANVRPCISYDPIIETKHPDMDVVIIRENEEDLYAGIEYRQSPNVCESLKVISRAGSEKIIRYAFEYAKLYNRKKVTCFTKDNIMKLSDGLFHQVFEEIAHEYNDIISEHWIVDIGAAKLADTPEIFDVIVLPNLYGDILSDVAAQICGSVGLAGSANIGDKGAMFEAIHGSAPRRAGQNLANPSGLLLAAVQMLLYLGEGKIAEKIHNGWLATLENKIHTYDIYQEGSSAKKVGTKEFAQAVIEHLGKTPSTLSAVSYDVQSFPLITPTLTSKESRKLVGCDIYIYNKAPLEKLLPRIDHLAMGPLHLTLVTNRGVKVWPEGHAETFCIEQFRLRFLPKDPSRSVSIDHIIQILHAVVQMEIDVIKLENLYSYDDIAGYSSKE